MTTNPTARCLAWRHPGMAILLAASLLVPGLSGAVGAGTTAGIGYAIAKGLAQAGAHVVLNGRSVASGSRLGAVWSRRLA